MIYAVNLNPTIDKTVYVEKFVFGGTNRVVQSKEQGGGKALNVSLLLKHLDIPVYAVGFIGYGNSNPIIAAFDEIPNAFIEVADPSRVNLKVVDQSNFTTTEINEKGPEISTPMLAAFDAELYRLITKDDILILTGALPPGIAENYYAKLVETLPCKVVVDASGGALRYAAKAKPYLIKPNTEELSHLTGKTYETLPEIIKDAHALVQDGIEICVVSMGKDGALIVNKDEAYVASAVVENPDSTVGAGDSMLGGILSVLTTGGNIKDALCWGTAASAATIILPGTDMAQRDGIEAMLPKVNINKIEV